MKHFWFVSSLVFAGGFLWFATGVSLPINQLGSTVCLLAALQTLAIGADAKP